MDVHVPRAATVALRMRGIDVLTAQQDGSASLDDAALLHRASSLQRVLVTQDDDLLREGSLLHRSGIPFSGIVYAHQLRITIGQLVDDLELLAKATEPEEWNGRIEYLPLG
jgi:predicted nuclease of predicted toxin-antitoxin system